MNNHPIAALITARCRLLGYSERTAETYSVVAVRFEDWSGCSALEASQEQAAAWMLAAGGSRLTMYHRRCGLMFLFKHGRGEPLDERVVPRLRQPPSPPPVLADPEEIAEILAAIADPEQRLFCRFVYATGLRLAETLQVRVADLDERGLSVLVCAGKGGRQRRAILPPSLIVQLRRHCRGRLPGSRLFGDGTRPFSTNSLALGLRSARRRAGISKRVTVHTLRHCFATHLHERGIGVCELQRLLGHTTILTTMHYIGQRERRRVEIAQVGDLLAALPEVRPGQQTIEFR